MSLLGITWEKKSQALSLGYEVSVWRAPVNPYLIRIRIAVSGGENNGWATERVFSGETSARDADKWVGNIVGYPNPFYGEMEYGASGEGLKMWLDDLRADDERRKIENEHRAFLSSQYDDNGFYLGQIPFYPSR
jgi:hypothetical protein